MHSSRNALLTESGASGCIHPFRLQSKGINNQAVDFRKGFDGLRKDPLACRTASRVIRKYCQKEQPKGCFIWRATLICNSEVA